MMKSVPFKSSLRIFFIRIILSESLLFAAFITALTFRYRVYLGDGCNLASDTECTTIRTQDCLLIFAVASGLGVILLHATAIVVGVRAFKNNKKAEPARNLLSDTLLTVFGMPLLAAIFWFAWKTMARDLVLGIDRAVGFVENIYR